MLGVLTAIGCRGLNVGTRGRSDALRGTLFECVFYLLLLKTCLLSSYAKNIDDDRKLLPPETVYGVLNSTVRLPCRILATSNSNSRSGIIATWKRLKDQMYLVYGDQILTMDDRFKGSFHQNPSNFQDPLLRMDLTIEKIGSSDEGSYECLVSGTQLHKKVITLKVLVPPSIVAKGSSARKIQQNEGEAINLVCNSWGRPRPNITWYSAPEGASKTILTSDSRKGIYIDYNKLMIANVSRSLKGIITCVASNGVGPKSFRDTEIDILYPPTIVMVNTRIGQLLQKTTMVQALVTGYPVMAIYWMFHGQRIVCPHDNCMVNIRTQKHCISIERPLELHTVRATLWIVNLTSSDYGPYKCVVESPFGTYSGVTEVTRTYPVEPRSWDSSFKRREYITSEERDFSNEKQNDAFVTPAGDDGSERLVATDRKDSLRSDNTRNKAIHVDLPHNSLITTTLLFSVYFIIH